MTTLLLPRYTKLRAPESEVLARLVAHDLGLPLSWETDVNRSQIVVDLGDADPDAVARLAGWYADEHGVAWEVRP